MSTIAVTTKTGKLIVIKDSKVEYSHAWIVTVDNGQRVVEYGFTAKGAEVAKLTGAKALNSNKDCGFRNEQGKFVAWKTLGMELEVVAVEKA